MKQHKKILIKVILLTLLMSWGSSPAWATNVAVFNDGAYVDNAMDDGAEATNMIGAANAFGHTVTPFTGITAADFTNALMGQQVLIIPDLELGDLGPDLAQDAIDVLLDFVNNGGRLIIANSDDNGNATSFLNTVFGFTLTFDDTNTEISSDITPAAGGTIFEGQANTLPGNDASMALDSLPPEGLNIYNTAFDTAMVFIIPVGSGQIVYLGYDWFQSDPPNPGQQDGGWSNILRAALADADLGLSKNASSSQVTVGDNITYTITVTNSGPSDAIGVEVVDTLPASVSLVSSDSSQGSCSGTDVVLCDLGNMANGEVVTITLVVTTSQVGDITNLVEVFSQTIDGNANNDNDSNTVTVITIVVPVNDLSGSGCSIGSSFSSGAVWAYFPLVFLVLLFVGRRKAKS